MGIDFNFAFYLSLVLAAFACTGLLLAGRGKWYGWAVGLAAQPFWALFAIVTKSYGLIITCLMYGSVNAWNLLKWRKSKNVHNIAVEELKGMYMRGAISAEEYVKALRRLSGIDGETRTQT